MEAFGELLSAFFQLIAFAIELAINAVILVFKILFFGTREALMGPNRERAERKSLPRPISLAVLVSVIFVAIVGGGLLSWRHLAHRHRVATTEQLVDRLAEKYYQETTKPDAQFQNGPLAEVDAWGRPVRLDAEKSLLGWWIVVSSDGPDGRPATFDDVKSVRENWNNLEQVGGELAQRGTNKVKEKIQGLFTSDKPDEALPADEQPAEQDQQADVVALETPVTDEPQPAEAEVPEGNEKQGWKAHFKFGFGKSD